MKVLIGVDPDKVSMANATAVAIDGDETQLAQLKVRATKAQCGPATHLGGAVPAHAGGGRSSPLLIRVNPSLGQQLVAAGEDVVDMPPRDDFQSCVTG
jgi:hypothetical protein